MYVRMYCAYTGNLIVSLTLTLNLNLTLTLVSSGRFMAGLLHVGSEEICSRVTETMVEELHVCMYVCMLYVCAYKP